MNHDIAAAELQQDNTLSDLLAGKVTSYDELDQSTMLDLQSDIAGKLLSVQGWDIAKELFAITYDMVDVTKLYVIPVMSLPELVKEKMGEHYDAFNARFTTFREDLANIAAALGALHAKHADRTGGVSMEDSDLVAEITLGYSTIQTQIEENVCPEMLLQMEMLEAAGISAEVLLDTYNKATVV